MNYEQSRREQVRSDKNPLIIHNSIIHHLIYFPIIHHLLNFRKLMEFRKFSECETWILFQLVVISFNSFQKQHLPPKNNYSFNLDQFLFAQFIFFVYFCHEKMANDRASFRKNAYLCSNFFHTMPVAANSAHGAVGKPPRSRITGEMGEEIHSIKVFANACFWWLWTWEIQTLCQKQCRGRCNGWYKLSRRCAEASRPQAHLTGFYLYQQRGYHFCLFT